MTRRKLILAICLAGGLSLPLLDSATRTAAGIFHVQLAQASQVGDLKQQLQSHLRPRSPQEFAFIDRVVSMVQRDELPLRTVKATFNWARKKPRQYRFPYFQRALQIEAARLGIRVS